MKNNKILKSKGGIILIIVFALIFLITSVLFKVFGITDIWAQLTGTLLGTIITAIVTVLLLGVQTNKEIGHDRDVGIFEKKQEVYFDFIETLEQITQDGRINVPGVPGYIEGTFRLISCVAQTSISPHTYPRCMGAFRVEHFVSLHRSYNQV